MSNYIIDLFVCGSALVLFADIARIGLQQKGILGNIEVVISISVSAG